MLRWFNSRLVWGSLLVVAGLVFLLDNLGLLRVGDIFWGIVLAVGAVAFLVDFFSDRTHWWSLVPGVTLLGLSSLVVISRLAPAAGSVWGGAIFLGSMGLAFYLVFLVNRAQWWALIPGGVMVTLAIVSALDEISSRIDTGGIFFLGLGATFALVGLLSPAAGPRRWPWIPAGILSVMGVLFLLAAGELSNLVVPVLLIGAGVVVLVQALRRNQA